MKPLLLASVLLSFSVLAAEAPLTQSGPNPMQFTGRVFMLAVDDPLGEIKPPAKVGYTALVLDELITVRTDIGQEVTTDRVQFLVDDGTHIPNGTRVMLDCAFVMGAETHYHFEPLFCGQSKVQRR